LYAVLCNIFNDERQDNNLEYGQKASYTLNDDFKIFIDAQSICMPDIPTYLPYGILGICRSGNASIKLYIQEFELIKNNLLVILPGQVAALKNCSEDFLIDYFILSEAIINETLSGISRLSPLFFIHMRKKCLYSLMEDEVYRYTQYHKLVYNRLLSHGHSFRQEYIVNILRLFYLDLYNNYKNDLLSTETAAEKRKEQLAYNFFLLIVEHYKEQKEVAFYAEKLHITPKYLSAVIKEVSRRSAKEWITEYLLLEVKSLLKNSSINVQEITLETNFSNQASLGRFFRKHTGMSPTEYRLSDKDDNIK